MGDIGSGPELKKIYHPQLAAGRWQQLSFCEQMGHVGSEVSRALNWRSKGNDAYSKRAVERALELLDLTVKPIKTYARLKELLRVREALVDYFYGDNEYKSSELLWRRYFDFFALAACRDR